MGGGFGQSGPFEQGVSFWTRPKLGSLGFQVIGKIFQSIWKGQSVLETATLHHTTSCLRVLTAGFALTIIICGRPPFSSLVHTRRIRTALLTVLARPLGSPRGGPFLIFESYIPHDHLPALFRNSLGLRGPSPYGVGR